MPRVLTVMLGAERHANCAADHKRQDTAELDGAAQFPHRGTLHNQRKGDDQWRGLRRAEEMQPNRGSDNGEGETGEAGDKGSGKGADRKQGEIESLQAVHGIPHRVRCAISARGQGNTWPFFGLRVVASDLFGNPI